VRGSAYRLPFRAAAFDAAIFVHVLHVLDEPQRAIAEAARVAPGGVFGLVRPGSGTERERSGAWDARRRVFEILKDQGYAVARDGRGGPHRKERELLAALPPDELVVLGDRTVTEPVARSLDMIARRASRHILDVPPEALAQAVDTVRREVGDRTFTFRRVEALATWRPRSAAA
jgi:SAM-dependent methyltransferase